MPSNAPANIIDSYLRRIFHLASGIEYFLTDIKDTADVDISWFSYLDDESNVSIKIDYINSSSNNEYSSDVDNNEVMLDLSSARQAPPAKVIQKLPYIIQV
ncbi:unnamed protein product [Rotaria magnacalcarata]|nr:unnamed protein product [Rotaria magnacalcarata]CAF3752132.1 unnamed protein product [Rotaria magnacalcarata]CAF4030668.1 unnamed protein product [Rotaria magnacalcarata]CAF4325919.1 unnamed protein product [Rotaria magnacalcarata]